MEEQIIVSGADSKGFSNWKGIDLFNIRFKKEHCKVNDPYCELPKDNPIYEQSRYAFVFYKDEFNLSDEKDTDFQFTATTGDNDPGDHNGTESKIYTREPKSVEITYLHKAISKALTAVLKNQFGRSNVKAENRLYNGAAKRVDIVVKDSDSKYVFYEIKTYNSVLTSIREAIGQLIEYAFWPDKENAKELIIITQKPQDIGGLKVYLAHLRKLFNIPLYYQWFDSENNVLSNKI